MMFSTRSLTLALAAGALTLGGVHTPGASAQGADAPADPMAGFTMPEPAPAHDYASGADAEGFTSLEERVSYAIGLNIGTGLSREFEQMDATLDSVALSDAIEQAVSGGDTKLSEEQVGMTLQAFQQQMMEQQMAAAEQKAQENQAMAETFFAENGAKDGVVTTDSGLQYTLETRGEGAVPAEGQVVTLNYRGTLLDGTEFDTSYDSPEPAEFPVGAVIPGFNEALLLMPVGSKGTLWIPADLAYGDSPPRGSAIEPGAPLIFELEILGVDGDGDGMGGGDADADAGAGDDADGDDGLKAPHRDPIAE